MQLVDFYNILDINTDSSNTTVVKIEIEPSHTIFKGHFPGHAVTPGVALLQIIKALLESHFNAKLKMLSVSNVKFLLPVYPEAGNQLVFQLEVKKENGVFNVKNRTTFPNGDVVLNCNAIFTTE